MRVPQRTVIAGAAGLLLSGALFVLLAAPSPTQEEPEYVGGDLCAECHVDQAAKFEGTIHDDVLEYFADEPEGLGGCESCHGPGSLHVELASGLEPGFRSAIQRQPDPEACVTCHTDVGAQFTLTERHPVLEGFMGCSDCHDPHGSSERRLLASNFNDTCTDCHTDKAGPFIYPHPVAEVEGCVACHTPHGSVNPHMLPFREVTFTCLSCHAEQPVFHAQPGFADCTSCHYAIHGSNLDPFFLDE